jgi:hypothetical protein
MAPVDAVRERLAVYFRDQVAEVLTGRDALDEARRLLHAALRVQHDDEVAVEADLLALAALFFWSRWMEAPTDFEDPDCRTAFRLYAVLRAVDPGVAVPPQLDAPLAGTCTGPSVTPTPPPTTTGRSSWVTRDGRCCGRSGCSCNATTVTSPAAVQGSPHGWTGLVGSCSPPRPDCSGRVAGRCRTFGRIPAAGVLPGGPGPV